MFYTNKEALVKTIFRYQVLPQSFKVLRKLLDNRGAS